MNREIEFRAKEAFTGDWVYGNYVRTPFGHYIISQNVLTNELPQYKADSETVGQYTGLKDKNGTDIYEGDILRVNGIMSYFNAQVKFGRYEQDGSAGEYEGTLCYGFYAEAINENETDEYRCEMVPDYEYKTSLLYFEHVEVIGNIFEYPELLEESS